MNNILENELAKRKHYYKGGQKELKERLPSIDPVELLPTNTNVRKVLTPSKVKQERLISNTDYNFCVMSGKEYCLKVIAFHHSLQKHCLCFNLWICCMDDFTFSLLKKLHLKNVHLIHVEDLEDDALRKVKQERKPNEYCWTIKASLVEYLLTKYNLEKMIYCDGDLYFFSDPAAIFEEWGNYSVFLCPQRDLDWVEQMYGRFQAGLIGFKNDPYGRESLKWWKERCIEWCSHEENNGRFGDQKYLDQFPLFFQRVKISAHLGINAAPWNSIYNNNFEISTRNQQVFIQNQPLVVFHFACLSIFDQDKFDLWSLDTLQIPNKILNQIYAPYLEEIRVAIKEIKAVAPNALRLCLNGQPSSKAKTFYHDTSLRREMDQYDDFFHFSVILSQDYVMKGIALYFSLKNQMKNFRMWICCMDEASLKLLKKLNLANVTLIEVKDIEDEELLAVKGQRTLQEYCWTLKAPLCQHILSHYNEVNQLFYCDSDLYFFSNPKPLLENWGLYSIFLCRQRGTNELERIHGQYQAGLIGFRNEENSMRILNWWRNKCLERCSAIYEPLHGTWGDQKYLDAIPHLFSNIKISEDLGINAAPWNLVMNNHYSVSTKGDQVMIDGHDLIVYHFGSLLILDDDRYDLWKLEPLAFEPSITSNIYEPYISQLKQVYKLLKKQLKQESLAPFFATVPDEYKAKNPFQTSQKRKNSDRTIINKRTNKKKRSFKNKRVLVTGGFGFIGSHLVRRLLQEKAKVAVLVRETSNPWRVEDVLKDVHVIKANIEDTTTVLNAVLEYSPHYVFHLAAYGVNSNQNSYEDAFNTNVRGTTNIVRAAKAAGCKKIINLGSSSEYGDKSQPIHEEMALNPIDIYGKTKARATLLSHQIAKEIGIPIVTLRPFGVFGEMEDSHKLFGYIIKSLLNNQEVKLTSCEQFRDYCYVGNLIDGMILAALRPSFQNEIFNIGSGEVFPLKHFVKLIFENFQTNQKPQYGAIPNRGNERNYPLPDISKIKTMLGWKPAIQLEEGIIRTINWYKQNG
jgi:nucleoside-diphosphate-sugar epimerase